MNAFQRLWDRLLRLAETGGRESVLEVSEVVPESETTSRERRLGPLPLDTEVEHYRLGLHVGYYSSEEVVAWADSILASEFSSPGADLIELSLMNHPDCEAISLQIRGGYREPSDMRLPIARLFEAMAEGVRSGEREPAKVATNIHGIVYLSHEMFMDIAPDASVVDEFFSPLCHWITENPEELLLELLDRVSRLLRQEI